MNDDIKRIMYSLEETDEPDGDVPEAPSPDAAPPSDDSELLIDDVEARNKRTRRILIAAAIVLTIVLGVLVWLLLTGGLGDRIAPLNRTPVSGISAELVIDGPGTGDLPKFDSPMGAAFSRNGELIYVADSGNDRVCIFERDGTYVSEFGGKGVAKPIEGTKPTWDEGELNYPVDIAVDRQGLVYVADFYNDSISVFSAEGEFVRRFPDPHKVVGKGGSGSGGTGIAVTSVHVAGNRLYATDSYQVFVFSLEGELIQQFGRPGIEPGQFDRPGGVAVDDGGRIAVSDSNNNRVTMFTPMLEVLWSTGGRRPLEYGATPTQTPDAASEGFVLPRGITVIDGGDLLIADPLAQELVRVSGIGRIVTRYGSRGVQPSELNFPSDVDWMDERVLITDRENDRVQVARLVDE